MLSIPMDFSFSSLLSDGVSSFNTIFNAVTGNGLMVGVIGFTLVVGMIALVWGIFH